MGKTSICLSPLGRGNRFPLRKSMKKGEKAPGDPGTTMSRGPKTIDSSICLSPPEKKRGKNMSSSEIDSLQKKQGKILKTTKDKLHFTYLEPSEKQKNQQGKLKIIRFSNWKVLSAFSPKRRSESFEGSVASFSASLSEPKDSLVDAWPGGVNGQPGSIQLLIRFFSMSFTPKTSNRH